MWLDPFFSNKLLQDVVATTLTFLLSLALWMMIWSLFIAFGMP